MKRETKITFIDSTPEGKALARKIVAGIAHMNVKKACRMCPFCNKDISIEVFRDRLSVREAELSGLCQKCQDDFFKKGGDE